MIEVYADETSSKSGTVDVRSVSHDELVPVVSRYLPVFRDVDRRRLLRYSDDRTAGEGLRTRTDVRH